MKVAIAALFLVAAVSAIAPLQENEYEFLFTQWMRQHAKTYATDELFSRYSTWRQNLDAIRSHNAQNNSYTLAMNQFGDLTSEEFKKGYTGFNNIKRDYLRSRNIRYFPTVDLPVSVDWRTSGKVNAIKNQAQCGSCWAFSAIAAVESGYAIAKGQLYSLSEQQLVDCSTSYGNQGCNGGLMDQAFEYIKASGVTTEAAYPYTGADGKCKSGVTAQVKVSGYTDLAQDEAQIQAAVAAHPVSIAIEADQFVFQFYSGGVLDNTGCGTTLDHGVAIVGYGTDAGKDYWIVRNSWGTTWGEKGYVRLVRGKNECGLSLSASFPTF